jgi:hypothetical protein
LLAGSYKSTALRVTMKGVAVENSKSEETIGVLGDGAVG